MLDMKVAYHIDVLWALSRVSSVGNVRKDARDEAPTSGGRLDQMLKSVVVWNVSCLHPLTWGEAGGGMLGYSQWLSLAIFKKFPKNLVKK